MNGPTGKARAGALALCVLGVWLLRRRRQRRIAADPPAGAQTDALRYDVPVGQDPAAVIAALRQAGYRVARDLRPTHIQELLITSPGGTTLDRDQVRAAIERAPIDIEGASAPPHAVVFADETGPPAPTQPRPPAA